MAITCNDIITLAAKHMQDGGYNTNSEAEYILMANKAQNRIAEINQKDWASNTTTDSVNGTQAYALPADYMKIYSEVDSIKYTDSLGKVFYPELTTYEFVRGNKDLITKLGTPFYYWLDDRGRIWFYPTPDYAGTNNISIEYVCYPTQFTVVASVCDFIDRYLFSLVYLTCMFMSIQNELDKDILKWKKLSDLELNALDISGDLLASRFEGVEYTGG